MTISVLLQYREEMEGSKNKFGMVQHTKIYQHNVH